MSCSNRHKMAVLVVGTLKSCCTYRLWHMGFMTKTADHLLKFNMYNVGEYRNTFMVLFWYKTRTLVTSTMKKNYTRISNCKIIDIDCFITADFVVYMLLFG